MPLKHTEIKYSDSQQRERFSMQNKTFFKEILFSGDIHLYGLCNSKTHKRKRIVLVVKCYRSLIQYQAPVSCTVHSVQAIKKKLRHSFSAIWKNYSTLILNNILTYLDRVNMAVKIHWQSITMQIGT
jgi:hypothetical protein